jgi:cytochrome c553
MRYSRPKRRDVIAFIFMLVAYISPLSGSAKDCPKFPEVKWWGAITHDTITEYVERKNDGDWRAYITLWERRLENLEEIHQKGWTATIEGVALSESRRRYKVRLNNKALGNYIERVKERIDILYCLANLPRKGDKTLIASPFVEDFPNQGEKLASEKKCLGCHSPVQTRKHSHIPTLAGQNMLYLLKQLKEFQESRETGKLENKLATRHSAIMQFPVTRLAEKEIWLIAEYFSKNSSCKEEDIQPFKIQPPKESDTCITCHGPKGISHFPEVPNLAGQNFVYLQRQLTAFKASIDAQGNRSYAEDSLSDLRYHYYMSQHLKALSEETIESLAQYYNGLRCLPQK